jgi:hypothetical protein
MKALSYPSMSFFACKKKGSAVFQVLSWELADKIFNV